MEMTAFKWDAKYETGLPEVDAQHRGLVEIINRLGDQRIGGSSPAEVEATLGKLAEYARFHFETEDAVMRAAGISPDHFAAHSRTHELFLSQIKEIAAEAGGEVAIAVDQLFQYLVKWLAFHILGQDLEMAAEIGALQHHAMPETARREGVGRSTEVLFEALNSLYDDLAAAHTKLRASTEAQLKEAERLAHLGSWDLDLPSRSLTWSDEIYRIFEIDPQKFGASYEAFLEAVHPEDRELVDQTFKNSVAHRTPYEITHRLLMPDGRVKYVKEAGTTHYSADGRPLRSIGMVLDITQSVLAEQAIRTSEERFRTVADYTYDWEYWRGVNGEFLYLSPSCERITGYTAQEFTEDPGLLLRIIHPDDTHLMVDHLRGEHLYEKESALDFRIIRKDGEIQWIAHACQPVLTKDGQFQGRRASNRDITERMRLEQELREQARTDYLTGMANRRQFMERAEGELARAGRYDRPVSLLLMDIDHFKRVNDTHGHQVGDTALKAISDRCRQALRKADFIGRIGGEEFAILLPETPGDGARAIADRLRQAIAEFAIATPKGDGFFLTLSIGCATRSAGQPLDLDTLFKQADDALYEAKAAGRNRVCCFSAAATADRGAELGKGE
jgi:diguanylate cyclase (GGDEF)-like protein/hemerythrin-like metal-binding protein/PAS domain S-box-containing protein